MYTSLPLEVLQHILTDECISKKDLLQLQITCKQWSSVARIIFYENIYLQDYRLYRARAFNYSATKERLALLVQSLIIFGKQTRKYVKVISFGSFLCARPAFTPVAEDPLCFITMLVHLCPNITSMGETIFPNEYYATITNLHQEGYLQHLEYLEPPEFLDEDDKNATNYHTALLEFRDTLEDITVTDAVCKNIKTECLIAPASMQLFSSLKKVTFRESSRINLCGMRDYIANCGSTVKSFNFSMRGKTSTPLQVDYNDQHPTYPRENVQKLCIDLDTSLETAELSFIMCTFPSPQDFTFEISEDFEQDLVVQHHDLEVAVQFFRYLAHIPEVTCQSLWFDVSQGLDLLSHLVNFMDIQIVSIDCKASTDRGTGLALALYTPYITTATKTESFHAIINIYSNETHASFIKAFEGLKGESIKQITIGPTYNYSKSLLQKVQQPLIDYILDNYGGLQDLTFAGVEFPSPTPCSAIQRVKQLQKLHIDKCSITEDYFARLSYHFEKIGCLKFTHFELHDADPTASGAKEKTNIYMPYTAVDTFDLTMYVSSLILKAWANYNYIVLKWAGTGFIVAEANDTNSTPGAYEVTIHCASLKQISILDTVFKLP